VNSDTGAGTTTARKKSFIAGAALGGREKKLVGLDIGSTKTCVLIAEVEGELGEVLALGAAESKGLRKGLIVNLDSTVSFHPSRGRRSRKRCERSSRRSADRVAGGHVRGRKQPRRHHAGPRPRDIERDESAAPWMRPATSSLPETAKSCTSFRMNSWWMRKCIRDAIGMSASG